MLNLAWRAPVMAAAFGQNVTIVLAIGLAGNDEWKLTEANRDERLAKGGGAVASCSGSLRIPARLLRHIDPVHHFVQSRA